VKFARLAARTRRFGAGSYEQGGKHEERASRALFATRCQKPSLCIGRPTADQVDWIDAAGALPPADAARLHSRSL
jgi:hypothetical protein